MCKAIQQENIKLYFIVENEKEEELFLLHYNFT